MKLVSKALRHLVLTLGARIRWGTIHLVDQGSDATLGSGSADEPSVTVRVLDSRFYSSIALGGAVGFGESYMSGYWSCDDLVALVRIMIRCDAIMQGVDTGLARLGVHANRFAHFLRDNTRLGSRKNIAAHYDLGNDFYRLFLDEGMTYSAAVYEREEATLEEAQTAKIDLVCRKLALGPGDNLLEIGTGWGALACHAAREYGCQVTTTTISKEQHRYARDRVAHEGLEGRVTVLEKDYRDLGGKFDKLVSIEMIEAVGAPWHATFFKKVSDLLRPDGLMLLQAITLREQEFARAVSDTDFVKKHIFPGSCLLSVARVASHVTEHTDLALTHLEDLTADYARTLREWRRRFHANLGQVRALGFGEEFVRMWEMYFTYCEAGFEERYIRDVQIVLAKPLCRIEPVGRASTTTTSAATTSTSAKPTSTASAPLRDTSPTRVALA